MSGEWTTRWSMVGMVLHVLTFSRSIKPSTWSGSNLPSLNTTLAPAAIAVHKEV